jgi:L-ascorbate metabolism protein UlaG (beta-lactamase superfamily)
MTKIIFHGHSFLEIEHNQRSILIDPFIEGNPQCDTSLADVKLLGIDAIILTHGHADHL